MFRHDALAKGRFKRVPSRWDTEFGRWVADFGAPRIVAGLARNPDLHITNLEAEFRLAHISPDTLPSLGVDNQEKQQSASD